MDTLKLTNCFNQIRSRTDFEPEIAVVLGSGLGDFADGVESAAEIEYGALTGFPVSTVSGHAGRFVFGRLNGVRVAVMRGRVHFYEGYSMQDVVLPVRLLRMLGAKYLILTNAAGGINKQFRAGDLVAIKGQISSFVPSPLIGKNIDPLGARFPDMSEIYDKKLVSLAESVATRIGIPLKKGVYLQTTGPAYESPEEIKMFARLGADMVGMSTACEAVAAKHAGFTVCGVSCITNMAAGIQKGALSHEEVKITADKTSGNFKKLLAEIIAEISAADEQ